MRKATQIKESGKKLSWEKKESNRLLVINMFQLKGRNTLSQRIFKNRKLPLEIQILLAKCQIKDYQTYAELEKEMFDTIELVPEQGIRLEIITLQPKYEPLKKKLEQTKFYGRTTHAAYRKAILHVLNIILFYVVNKSKS